MVTLAVFYYFYLAVILFFIIYSLFNIYHLIRFGFFSLTNIAVMILYILVASLFIMYSFELLMLVDWNLTLIDLGDLKINSPFSNNQNLNI